MIIDPKAKSGRFVLQALVEKMRVLHAICECATASEDEVSDASNDFALYKGIVDEFQAELDFDATKGPEWVTKGKNITQLIKELGTFEDQNLEVRLTFDGGTTHKPISILTRRDGFAMMEYCGL
jgi:hypothetical protein